MQFLLSFSLFKIIVIFRIKNDARREISSAFVEANLLEMCEHLSHNGLVKQHQDDEDENDSFNQEKM